VLVKLGDVFFSVSFVMFKSLFTAKLIPLRLFMHNIFDQVTNSSYHLIAFFSCLYGESKDELGLIVMMVIIMMISSFI